MSFLSKYQGKRVTIDPKNPEALGICDYTDFVFNHKDLVKQMEWRGDSLVWTGWMVGRPYVDTPNEQNRPPLVKDDPRPIKDPRVPQDTVQDTLNFGAPGIASSAVQVNYTDPEINPLPSYNQVLQRLNQVRFNEGSLINE
jgi:hypothetical protein